MRWGKIETYGENDKNGEERGKGWRRKRIEVNKEKKECRKGF